MPPETSAQATLLQRIRSPLSVAGGILALDQASKLAVSRHMLLGDQIRVLDGFLNIVHARNPGAAFSFLATAPDWFRGPFFIGVSIIAVIAILTVLARSEPDEWVTRISLGGILGGALGNLVDRIRLGEVIDFVDVYWRFHHWPAFNVADSAISLSVAAIFAHSLLSHGQGESTAAHSDVPQP
jgi:signal peptidase II